MLIILTFQILEYSRVFFSKPLLDQGYYHICSVSHMHSSFFLRIYREERTKTLIFGIFQIMCFFLRLSFTTTCIFSQVYVVTFTVPQWWQRFHQSFCASATSDPRYWADHRWRSEFVSHSHLTQHHPSAIKTRTTNLHLWSCRWHGHISGWGNTVIINTPVARVTNNLICQHGIWPVRLKKVGTDGQCMWSLLIILQQDSVFSIVAKNIVESCMNGYNGTIFA